MSKILCDSCGGRGNHPSRIICGACFQSMKTKAQCCIDNQAENDRLRAKTGRLKEALSVYGGHTVYCREQSRKDFNIGLNPVCQCGYGKIMEEG